MSSRLFTEVREKRGLCYAVGAQYRTIKDYAGISCYAGTTPDKAQETLDVVVDQFNQLKNGISNDEMQRAKVGLKTSLIMQCESTGSRSAGIASDYFLLGHVRGVEEIREKIIGYPVFQREGKFVGFEEYKRILEWNRISISEFEESLKKEIILNKVMKVLTAGITLAPEELWESYKNKSESAKMEFVILETEKIELEEEPLSSEIKEYFEENKEEYKIPERREAAFVFLKTEDLKAEIELTDSDIEKYYKENESQFKDPERLKVSRIYLPYDEKEKELILAEGQGILERIKGGEDFGNLAKKHSKDGKANNGGDWGLYEWQTLSSREKTEIEKLSEGEASGTVELEEGISILKVTEKKPSVTKSLEEVKEKLRTTLTYRFQNRNITEQLKAWKESIDTDILFDAALGRRQPQDSQKQPEEMKTQSKSEEK